MAYSYAYNLAAPADTDLVSQGAGEIREFKNAMKERVESFFSGIDAQPWVVKDGATLGNVNIKALTPVADASYSLGDASHRFLNAWFSGTVTASGQVTCLDLIVASSNSMLFANRSRLQSPADGVISLVANDGTTHLTQLAFGVNSTSASLVHDGVGLLVEKADTTGYTYLRASSLITDSLNFSNFTGTAKVIGGTTGTTLRNHADSADNLLITESGVVTSRSHILSNADVQAAAGNSVAWTGRSLMKSPSDGVVTFTNNAGSANAQINVGNVVADGICVVNGGILDFSNSLVEAKVIGSALGFVIRDFADSNDLFGITNSGAASIRSNLILTSGAYRIGLNQVVGARITGWSAATGTATRTAFATGTVTLSVLAEHVKALTDDLISHGLIGT